ncbi:FeoA family protein [Desulfosporosinus orientis]|uniref:FeoA family protein n=1 Tax=Desulfosporosinus orientis TaxID=1563 RepID=UPI003D05DC11
MSEEVIENVNLIQIIIRPNPGETCRVIGLEVKGLLRRRILDLGIVPGTDLTCVGKAPSGDPIAYIVRSSVIAVKMPERFVI